MNKVRFAVCLRSWHADADASSFARFKLCGGHGSSGGGRGVVVGPPRACWAWPRCWLRRWLRQCKPRACKGTTGTISVHSLAWHRTHGLQVKAVEKLNSVEAELGNSRSWHDRYNASAFIYIGAFGLFCWGGRRRGHAPCAGASCWGPLV